MLPKRLEMRNFLAYRTPDPLNFEDLHLACLSGHNGAGKSSLLDAITWAVWGMARTRSDDDLIHLGQTEMQVSLDFEQDAQLYRIIRKRKAGKPRKNG
jgi:exonuclease SbcC